jgi:hypothetical protein
MLKRITMMLMHVHALMAWTVSDVINLSFVPKRKEWGTKFEKALPLVIPLLFFQTFYDEDTLWE